MSRKHLDDLTDEQLVHRFVEISLAQDQALLLDEIAKYNRLFDQKTALLNELKSRPGDRRRALLSLFAHSNVQVRLNAAKATLAVEPVVARQLLQSIADSQEFPQAGHAGMSLWNLDRGIYKPT
jgi:hypothetical protein